MKLKELIYQEGDQENLSKLLLEGNLCLLEATKYGLTCDALKEIIKASFYPGYKPLEKSLPKAKDSNERVRLGITFVNKEITYRFVRDLKMNAFSLCKFDPKLKEFVEISKEPPFISKVFRDSFGFPDMELFDDLCVFDKSFLEKKIPNYQKQPNQKSYFDTLDTDASLMEKLRKLKGLMKEKENQSFIAKSEFELDGLQAKLFKIQDMLGKVKRAQEDLALVEGEYKEYASNKILDELPNGIEDKLKAFDTALETKNEKLHELDIKVEDLYADVSKLNLDPVFKDNLFITGCVFGIASFGLALFYSKLLYIFLPSFFICVGLVAWRLIEFFRNKDKEMRLQKSIMELKEEKKLIDKKFDIESSVVAKFVKNANAQGADDALDLIKRKRELTKAFERESIKLSELKASVDYDAIVKEKEELVADISKREDLLRSIPPASMDPNDLDDKINLLKSEIGEDNLSRFSAFFGDEAKRENHLLAIIESTSKYLNIDIVKLVDVLKKSLPLNLKILSEGYFEGVSFKDTSPVTFTCKKGDLDLFELSKNEHLLILFTLQFTLSQLVASQRGIPFTAMGILEMTEPTIKRNTFLSALNHLSKVCQVLHVIQ